MKKTVVAFVLGALLSTAAFAYADNPIKLIVNGQVIQCDVPPQNIDGRVLVPARYVAEALGAAVEWNTANNSVIITSKIGPVTQEPVKEDEDVTETTFKGIRAIEVNGQVYFNANEYSEILRNGELNPKNIIAYDKGTQTSTIHLNGETTVIQRNDENIQIYKGQTYFHTRFYPE